MTLGAGAIAYCFKRSEMTLHRLPQPRTETQHCRSAGKKYDYSTLNVWQTAATRFLGSTTPILIK